MQQDFLERYNRQLRLRGFGPEAQQKLTAARVLVVGAGGLGVPVLQYLAGMGVGCIGIIDDDVVSLSNLHRQVLYTTEDIGRQKARVAAAKLALFNPEIDIHTFTQRFCADCALDIICGYDIVVDATDNFSTRYLINDACIMLHKPAVYGAIQGYEGHISVFNVDGGPTYRCLYPTQPEAAAIPDCNTIGVLGVVPGIIGTMQALQVVKLITGIGKTLSGYLQVYDFLNDTQYKIRLKTKPENHKIARLHDYATLNQCNLIGHLLQPDTIYQWQHAGKNFTLVDVREQNEFSAAHIPSAFNLPLSQFNNSLTEINLQEPVVLYCQKGSRSARAFSLLQSQYPELELYELAGGFEAWISTRQQS